MKKLIRKGLREQIKIAVPAFLILTVILMTGYESCITTLKQSIDQNSVNRAEDVQPLLAQGLHMWVVLLCAIAGATLGAMQIFSERPRDRWAFFVHRPVTRARLFVAKVTSGLLLYFCAVLPPIARLIVVVATPGHVAAPFQWPMALPLLHAVFAGVVFYFAGMICALRRVRWYGSRLIPLGAGILVATLSFMPPFPLWMLCYWGFFIIIIAATVLSALGTFRNDGEIEPQTRAEKLGSIATLLVGMTIAWSLLGVVGSWLPHAHHGQFQEWSYYAMDRGGNAYKVVTKQGEPPKICDLQGHVAKDPITGQPIDQLRFNSKMVSFGPSFFTGSFDDSRDDRAEFFIPWKINHRDLWYWTRAGNLEGYDVVTRRPIGKIAANQFFQAPQEAYLNTWNPPGTVVSSNTIYTVDLEQRTATRLWTCSPMERIIGWQDTRYIIDQDDHGRDATTVLTSKRLLLIARDTHEVMLNTPLKAKRGDNVTLRFLRGGRFSIWITPGWKNGQPPTIVAYVSADGTETARTKLPELPAIREVDVYDQILPAITAPIVTILARLRVQINGDPFVTSIAMMISIVLSICCVVISILVTRRYSLSIAARIAWAVTTLLFGIPGVLVLLSFYEWPARVLCPKCGKLRVVTRESCEHCAAPFAPPQKLGIEIFAPLAKA